MKKLIVLVLIVALTLSLAACSSGGGAEESPAAGESAAPDNSGAPVDGTEVKDTLIVGTGGQPVRFFAAGPDGSNNNDLVVLNNVYEPLVALQPDGTVAPALAESWEISEDGLVYTFKLRQGVMFHNGEEMTAEDVAFTFDVNSQNSVGKALLINFVEAEIIDESTVAIHLSAPFAPFINSVASRAAYIFDKSYYEEVGVEGYLEAPIGTGAYKFVSSTTGDKVVMEAFDGYWAGEPSIKNIEVRIIADAATQIISLQSGDIDAILSPAIGTLISLPTDGDVSWESSPSAGRVVLHLSENSGYPGTDKNFRKAVQSAINKEDVIIGSVEGYATQIDIDMCPSYTAIPEGYDVVGYDIDAAKAYLEESDYNGEEFEIIVQSGTSVEVAAQIIQAQLMEIGINCTVTGLDAATFTERWYGGTFGGMMRNTTSSLVDADGMSNFFMATEYAPTDNNQYGRTQEIYDICMEARASQGEARSELYLEAVNIVTEEAYQVPLFANPNTMAYNKNLTGVEVHPLTLVTFYNWSW